MSKVSYYQDYTRDKDGNKYGPYWYKTWKEEGKTRKKYVGKELPEDVKRERQGLAQEVDELRIRIEQLEGRDQAVEPQSEDNQGRNELDQLRAQVAELETETLQHTEERGVWQRTEELLRADVERLQRELEEMTELREIALSAAQGLESKRNKLRQVYEEAIVENTVRGKHIAELQTKVAQFSEMAMPTSEEPPEMRGTISQFVAALPDEPTPIHQVLQEQHTSREWASWLIGSYRSQMETIGVVFGEPHTSRKGSLWIPTGESVATVHCERHQTSSDNQAVEGKGTTDSGSLVSGYKITKQAALGEVERYLSGLTKEEIFTFCQRWKLWFVRKSYRRDKMIEIAVRDLRKGHCAESPIWGRLLTEIPGQ